jgi:hypothetical protein
MDAAEFDRFADEYRQLHANNIRLSGESPEYFAEYKVADVSTLLAAGGFPAEPAILDFGAGVGTSVAHFRKHLSGHLEQEPGNRSSDISRGGQFRALRWHATPVSGQLF